MFVDVVVDDRLMSNLPPTSQTTFPGVTRRFTQSSMSRKLAGISLNYEIRKLHACLMKNFPEVKNTMWYQQEGGENVYLPVKQRSPV